MPFMKRLIVCLVICAWNLEASTLVESRSTQLQAQAEAFSEALDRIGKKGSTATKEACKVVFTVDETLPSEGYAIRIENGDVDVRAADPAAAAFAASDLLRRAEIDVGDSTP